MLITQNGYVLKKEVDRLKIDSDNTFESLAEVMQIAIRQLRGIITPEMELGEVIFECNNTTFQKWLNRGNCNVNYVSQFKELIRNLNELPIQYSIITSKTPSSLSYAKESNLKTIKQKLNLGGFDFDLDEEE